MSRPASSLAANCSGKHSGMLATCVINVWDSKSYKELIHPLQQAIIKEFESLTGSKITQTGIDGCGAPLFALSLKALANGVRNLLQSNDPVHQEVVGACLSNPTMVSGANRLPTLILEKGLFAKDGAEGVMIIGSGGLTHNLDELQPKESKPEHYIEEFVTWMDDKIKSRDFAQLVNYRTLAPHSKRAHPTDEHLLPIFLALGASDDNEELKIVENEIYYGILSTRSYFWGV